LLPTHLAFQATGLLVEIGQFGFQSGSLGAEFMQAPIDVGDGRLGLAQLIGGMGPGFFGLRHVATQGIDAALEFLQFRRFRARRRRRRLRTPTAREAGSPRRKRCRDESRGSARPCTDWPTHRA
jgi:hypothetical protein